MKEVFILIKEEIDFTTIYGIYNDYLKAEEDYNNLKKYQHLYSEDKLCIYQLDVNKFYNNEQYEKIL